MQKLAEEFNVSPTPVREAIGRLLEAGLVTTGSDANRKRNNYYVFDISDDQIEDLFAVRSAMEGCATFLCAQNGSGRDYSELKALANSFRTRLHSLVYDPESYSKPVADLRARPRLSQDDCRIFWQQLSEAAL